MLVLSFWDHLSRAALLPISGHARGRDGSARTFMSVHVCASPKRRAPPRSSRISGLAEDKHGANRSESRWPVRDFAKPMPLSSVWWDVGKSRTIQSVISMVCIAPCGCDELPLRRGLWWFSNDARGAPPKAAEGRPSPPIEFDWPIDFAGLRKRAAGIVGAGRPRVAARLCPCRAYDPCEIYSALRGRWRPMRHRACGHRAVARWRWPCGSDWQVGVACL